MPVTQPLVKAALDTVLGGPAGAAMEAVNEELDKWELDLLHKARTREIELASRTASIDDSVRVSDC